MMLEMDLPLISVIMPAYNSRCYIKDAIASVQAQTYSNWELLVIDDGSSDETCRVVQELEAADSRIRLYKNDRNMGTAATRNRGLELSKGVYVALLDSDDLWHPQKLEKQYELAKRESADIVYSSYAMVDAHGKTQCSDFLVPERAVLSQMLKENVIGCSTVLLSAEAMCQFRFSREYYHEDYVLWLDMLRAGKKAVGLREVYVKYRIHASGRAANKKASAKRRWIIYRSFMKMSVPKSLYYLSCYTVNGLRKYRARKNDR
jgi:teichuronic acid biosynthesis glycosyltransferase TuaG